jgi:hypothetical protein
VRVEGAVRTAPGAAGAGRAADGDRFDLLCDGGSAEQACENEDTDEARKPDWNGCEVYHDALRGLNSMATLNLPPGGAKTLPQFIRPVSASCEDSGSDASWTDDEGAPPLQPGTP